MKVYDFSKRELTEMPMINETSKFEYILNNNLITQIEEIPQTCYKLSLSNNKISFINSKLFSNLQLKFLDLSFNRIISLQGFEKFKLLEELNLSNNYIGDEQLNFLTNSTKLKTLNLSNNNLRSEEVKNIIYKIKSLQKLNLSNNNIEQLVLEKSNGLIELDLDNNKINFLNFNCNRGNNNENKFEFLMYLTANENRIQNVEGINNLYNLEYLSLSVNEIREISIKKLNKLKYLQLKSNLLENFVINKNNQLLQYIDVSFNNINSFTILGECNGLKNLILDNNKLSDINFGENKNINQDLNNNIIKFKNLELLDISFNLISDIKFLMIFNNVQKVNLSFNNIDNLIELLSILKSFSQLKELNLVENEFNKNIYNTEILSNNIFNNINDYYNSPNVNFLNKKQLNSYRSCILINTNNILCLDNINISKEEKTSALKLSEYKLNSIDVKSSNFSIYNNKNENKIINASSKKRLNNNDDLNDLKIESSLSKEEDINDENNINEIDYSEYSLNNLNNNTNNNYSYNNPNIKENNNIINKRQQNKIVNVRNIKNQKYLYNNNKNNNNNNNENEISLEDIKEINSLTNNSNTYNNNEIDIQTYDIKPDSDFTQNENTFQKNISNKIIQNEKNISIITDEDKLKIYKMLCQTLYNICDNKGYIYFKYFLSLAEELVQEYNISSQLNEMTKEIKLIMQSSLLPGKFHIKELLKLLQNKKYDSMYYIINQVLIKKPTSIISQSIHLSQCIKKRVMNKENDKENYENESDYQYNKFKISQISQNKEYAKSYDKYNKYNNEKRKENIIIEKNKNMNNKYLNNNTQINKNTSQNTNSNTNTNTNNKDYNILNTLKMKTPLLSANNNNNNQNYSENSIYTINTNESNQINKGCFNILFQSSSELNKLPDLKNELFLQNFIYFINHISFPIHFNETEQSFIIAISSQEKEYKFIQAFMSNFKMINFELNKWYCHNYYTQIFENYESYEFLFEHSLYIFYSYYNEIIDNFFNDVFQIQDCYLMIEDNPLNLFDQNTNNNTKIVMLALIKWKSDEDNNKNINNIVFNKNDNRYYFKNPFNWIGNNSNNIRNKNNNKNNKDIKNENLIHKNKKEFNILVPVYIFSNIVFNNNDTSSFIQFYNNTNNKTF